MSDHERWDETRRLGPDEPRRAGTGGGEGDRTQRLDPEQTRRLGSEDPGAGAGAHSGRQYDAVGDYTYEDPYGTAYGDPAATEEEVAEGPGQETPRRRDGLRSALMLLLGLGIGFVAALVVVALFGGETTEADADAVAARDERITALEDELADAEQRNEELETTVEQRDEQIEELQGGLADAEGDLAERQQELDDREQALDQREQELDDREQELDEREQAVEDREQAEGDGEGDGQGDGDPPPEEDADGDNGLPELDEEEAEALVDRVIERIRDIFR